MSLLDKSIENMKIAEDCLEKHQAYNAGVSRAYYSAFQCTKQYLIRKGVTDRNYIAKASSWGYQVPYGGNMEAFAHSSIWSVTKAYLNQTRSGFGLKIVGLGLNLHKSRKKADYDEDGFEASSLCSCIKSAQAIIDGLTGGKV